MVTGIAIISAIIFTAIKWPTLVDAAVEADLRLGMKERFTSSLEMAGVDGPMVEALHADTGRHLDRLKEPGIFRFTATRPMKLLVAPLLLFGIMHAYLPEFDLLDYRVKQETARLKAEAIDKRVNELENMAQSIEPPPGDKRDRPADFAAEINRIAEDLKEEKISEKQALARLTSLDEEMKKWREESMKNNPLSKMGASGSNYNILRDVVEDLKKGDARAASKKMDAIREKLAKGQLSKQEQADLEKELNDLSKMLGGSESEMSKKLSESLENAGRAMSAQDMQAALDAIEESKLSMEDMVSIMDQMAQMEKASQQIDQWRRDMNYSSEYCRMCGKKLKPCKHRANCRNGKCLREGHSRDGMCASCARGKKIGPGMKGPGIGKGGQVGELPDGQVTTRPTTVPGAMTKGRALATVLQRGSPQVGPDSSVDFVPSAFIEVQQEAEQALMKEEIPPGSKEFVRRYFSSLEPEDDHEHSDEWLEDK